MKVTKTDGCWLWGGSKTQSPRSPPYGVIAIGDGVKMRAHRWIYQRVYGAIPASLFVCHHCDTPLCVRPDHLFAGTPKDNVDDMLAKGRHVAWGTNATHCKRGHPFAGHAKVECGRRVCVTCRNTLRKARRATARAMSPPRQPKPRALQGTAAANKAKTACLRGHPLVGANVLMTATGARMCRECHRAHGRATAAKMRARLRAAAAHSLSEDLV